MSGETRAWLIGCIVAMFMFTGCLLGIVKANVQGNTERADIAKACVQSGGEWKQNASANFECVR